VRNKEKSTNKPGRSKSKKIRERAGELAMNHGKRAQDADETEVQRAKRELLDMQITSPRP
jgi:hypothetical protein